MWSDLKKIKNGFFAIPAGQAIFSSPLPPWSVVVVVVLKSLQVVGEPNPAIVIRPGRSSSDRGGN